MATAVPESIAQASSRHQCTLERLLAVFNEHTFEFDGEDARGPSPPPLSGGGPDAEDGRANRSESRASSAMRGGGGAVDLYHTNNTLKYLLTCCKAMVESSLFTLSQQQQQGGGSQSRDTSPDRRSRSRTAEVSVAQRVAALEGAVGGLERDHVVLADSTRKVDLLWAAMRVAEGPHGQQRRQHQHQHQPHGDDSPHAVDGAKEEDEGDAQRADALLTAFAARIAERVVGPTNASPLNAPQSQPQQSQQQEEPSSAVSLRAALDTSDRLGELEQAMTRQFKLMEREIVGLKASGERVGAQLDELDALHRERLNASLKSTYEQMDAALEDFVTVEASAAAQEALSARLDKAEVEARILAERVAALKEVVDAKVAEPSPLEDEAFMARLASMVGTSIADQLPEVAALEEDFATLREAMHTHVGRVEMNLSDMRADLADCTTQSATWNGIIATNEAIKGRMGVIEAHQQARAKAPMDQLKSVAVAAVRDVVGPIRKSVETLYTIFDLPNKEECAAIAEELAAAVSKDHAGQLEVAVKTNNYFTAAGAGGGGGGGAGTAPDGGSDGKVATFFHDNMHLKGVDPAEYLGAPPQHSGSSNSAAHHRQLLRRQQEHLIKTVHKGLPFRSLVAAIRRVSESLEVIATDHKALQQAVVMLGSGGGGRRADAAVAPRIEPHQRQYQQQLLTAGAAPATASSSAAAATAPPTPNSGSGGASTPRTAAAVAGTASADHHSLHDDSRQEGIPSLSDLAAVRARLRNHAGGGAHLANTISGKGNSSTAIAAAAHGGRGDGLVGEHSAAGASQRVAAAGGGFDFTQRTISNHHATAAAVRPSSSSAAGRAAVGGFF